MMKREILRRSSLLWILMIVLSGCSQEEYTPKPKGYFRIALPDTSYEQLDIDCPYSFEMNENARWIDKRKCWGDVYYPSVKARLQLTYKDVSKNNLDTLLEDGYTLAFKHTVRADGIAERLFVNESAEVYGILYNIKGDAATSTQFYVTDSTDHFLRGVLYIYAPPNADSLKPVNDYMYRETVRLIESLRWK